MRKEAAGERKKFNKHFNERLSEVKFNFGLASNSEESRERAGEQRRVSTPCPELGNNSWHRPIRTKSQHNSLSCSRGMFKMGWRRQGSTITTLYHLPRIGISSASLWTLAKLNIVQAPLRSLHSPPVPSLALQLHT